MRSLLHLCMFCSIGLELLLTASASNQGSVAPTDGAAKQCRPLRAEHGERGPIWKYMLCRCVDGEPVTIQHEPSNTRDRNALIVLGAQGQVPLLSSERIPAI